MTFILAKTICELVYAEKYREDGGGRSKSSSKLRCVLSKKGLRKIRRETTCGCFRPRRGKGRCQPPFGGDLLPFRDLC
jgi:hypothetical protein